jgi:tetratricopeptide (TPR) repeat protein
MTITQINLAFVYEKLERWTESEQFYLKGLSFFVEKAPDNPNYPKYLKSYAELLEKMGRQAEADECKNKADELKAKLEAEKQQSPTEQKE